MEQSIIQTPAESTEKRNVKIGTLIKLLVAGIILGMAVILAAVIILVNAKKPTPLKNNTIVSTPVNNEINPTQTPTPNTSSIESTESFSGRVFAFDFKYDKSFGTATSTTNKTTTKGNLFCETELVKFSNSTWSLSAVKGYLECGGGFGGDIIDEYNLTSKDEKTAHVIIVRSQPSDSEYTIMATVSASAEFNNTNMLRFYNKVAVTDIFEAKKDLVDLVKTLTYNPEVLRSEDFDTLHGD